jgi:hypothetical protein
MNGMIVQRQQPSAHWISWLCGRVNDSEHKHELERSRSRFKTYMCTGSRDGRRGPRGQRRAEQILQERAEAKAGADPMAAETEALAVADACLLAYLATDSEDSKDDEDFIPSIPVQ